MKKNLLILGILLTSGSAVFAQDTKKVEIGIGKDGNPICVRPIKQAEPQVLPPNGRNKKSSQATLISKPKAVSCARATQIK